MNNKISFIVPSYNVEKYICRCLESLIPFIEEGHEIIIVNDGSTDGTTDLISRFVEKYPQVKVVNQHNKGLSGARNSGLNVASNEYIWFIDSDDYIDYDAFDAIKYYLDKGVDLITFGRQELYKDKIINVPKLVGKTFASGIEYFEDAMDSGYYRTNVWDKIYRRSVIDDNDIRFIEGLLYEDMLFNLEYQLFAKKTVSIPVYPYVYNKLNTESISTKIKEKDLDILTYIERASDMVNTSSADTKLLKAYHQLIFNWVSSCLLNKYSRLSFVNDTARTIFNKAISNPVFLESAEYCSREKVRLRYKIFAKLLLFSPLLYKMILIGALRVSRLK